jgi:hypothetical protein
MSLISNLFSAVVLLLNVLHHLEPRVMIFALAHLPLVTPSSMVLIRMHPHPVLVHNTSFRCQLATLLILAFKRHPQPGREPRGTMLSGWMMTVYSSTLCRVLGALTLEVNPFLQQRVICGTREIDQPSFRDSPVKHILSVLTLRVPEHVNKAAHCEAMPLIPFRVTAKATLRYPTQISGITQQVIHSNRCMDHSNLPEVIEV